MSVEMALLQGLAGAGPGLALVAYVLWQAWRRELRMAAEAGERERRLGARIDVLEDRYCSSVETLARASTTTAAALAEMASRPCQTVRPPQ